jgi:hypothetical protein
MSSHQNEIFIITLLDDTAAAAAAGYISLNINWP